MNKFQFYFTGYGGCLCKRSSKQSYIYSNMRTLYNITLNPTTLACALQTGVPTPTYIYCITIWHCIIGSALAIEISSKDVQKYDLYVTNIIRYSWMPNLVLHAQTTFFLFPLPQHKRKTVIWSHETMPKCCS